MDELPSQYIKQLDNVAIVMADEPTPRQREKLGLNKSQTLFGLYEGVPLTSRFMNYNMVLPDKITIFKKPLLAAARSQSELFEKLKRTLWHEIAHYYGLNHSQIKSLQDHKSSD
jgi:predicted Zn-dependent protease with MMP-like domain